MGQRTFETRSLYLILAEKLFTLPAANEVLPLLALFAGKYQVGVSEAICWGVKSQRVLPKSVRAFSHRIFFFSSAVKLRLSNAASVSASVN